MDLFGAVGAAVVTGIVIAAIVGFALKRFIGNATFSAVLTPDDRQQIVEMKAFLDSMRRERAEQNEAQARREGRIEAQIENLGRSTGALDESTIKLERALRGDVQVMGNWGEMQLRKILEMSGLTEGISYTYQETFSSSDSTRRDLRTDVQVKLPNEKVIVIDSKNTLSSYLDYNSAENDEDRAAQETRILDSVRGHLKEIEEAAYQKNVRNCYPKVIMYFPFEIPYLLACRAEIKVGSERKRLREYAYSKDIIFATAANLLPILDGVAVAWAAQDQDKKIGKFLEEAEKTCAKVNTFLTTYQKIGKQLFDIGKTYREGMGQLAEGPGNVIKKLGELKSLKIESADRLPKDEDLVSAAEKVAEGLS